MATSVYAADGVNISEGDRFSAYAGEICKATYKNSPYVQVHDLSRGHFRGPRSFSFRGLPKGCTMDAAPDGIGTKVIVIDSALSHKQAARDVIGMTRGDITRYGGLGLVFTNVLDVNTLGSYVSDVTSQRVINQRLRWLMEGMGEVCKEQGLVAFKGETAELGPCVGPPTDDCVAARFNWAGTTIGVYHRDKMITGEGLRPGLVVMACREYGFRSNGFGSVRKAFEKRFGTNWPTDPAAQVFRHAAAVPTTLYDKFLCDANGWFSPPNFQPKVKMYLIVHVTGGSIRYKFGEDILFPLGLSASLPDLWEPPEIMRQCAEWRGMSEEECYEVLNGGQGVLVVIERKDQRDFIDLAAEHGIEAQASGTILAGRKRPKIVLRSKFGGGDIVYRPQ